MWARILIVGDDPVLLDTRADLLAEWEPTKSTSTDALAMIRATPPDLLILCQTVSERATTLIQCARALNPGVKALAVCQYWHSRDLDAEPYEVQLDHPGAFAAVVADLLSAKALASPQHHGA